MARRAHFLTAVLRPVVACPAWCLASWRLLVETVTRGIKDRVPQLGAALAFYAMLSVMPMLVLLLSAAGFFYGAEESGGHIDQLVMHYFGARQAEVVQNLLSMATQKQQVGTSLAIVNILILIFGASGVFTQLQDVLNYIWRTPARPGRAIIRMLKEHFLSFIMLLGTGLLMVTLVIASMILTAAINFATSLMPLFAKGVQSITLLANFGILTLVFAFTFKVIPAMKIAWCDVWIGAALASVLFGVGQFVIGFYLGHSGLIAGYGAAGSLVALLIWIYYSAQIYFFGAEFTYLYAHRFGSYKEIAPDNKRSSVPV